MIPLNKMSYDQVIKWLLEGDVSIQYQVHRDLLGNDIGDIQSKIEKEGWGRDYLLKRKSNYHWGLDFYQPKWISTHYTLLDLRNLNLNPNNKVVKQSIDIVLDTMKSEDGGIKLGPSTTQHSDLCVNGMFLNYASYFKSEGVKLYSVVDSILDEKMEDGGFNCRTTRSGAKHSSLHTTISVLEGLFEFTKNENSYRSQEVKESISKAEEFILQHQLYISDRTGEIINKEFTKLHYPCRWRYDILRALDYFQYSGKEWDNRMELAVDTLKSRENKYGLWNVNAAYPGQVHFKMEKAGKSSRWNTLRALRILKHFEKN